MIHIYEKETNTMVGQITEEQLKFLVDHLEEESPEDRDYYINRETIDLFETQGAEPALIALLRQSLGSREDMEIYWTKT